MSLPTIPTDNLYKFLAIAGLVLIITFEILYVSKGSQVTSRELALREDIELLQKRVNEKIDRGDAKEARELFLKLENQCTEYRKLAFDVDHFDVIGKQRKLFDVVGAVMSIIGFGLWYDRVQKYQDIILKKQAGK